MPFRQFCLFLTYPRPDAHATALVKAPISITPHLAELLAPDVDIKVKHGVVGLLKHLAVPKENRAVLGQAGIMHRLADSEIWTDKYDSVEIVQVATIGVAKHMCNGNREWCPPPLAVLELSPLLLHQRITQSRSCYRAPANPSKLHRSHRSSPWFVAPIQ